MIDAFLEEAEKKMKGITGHLHKELGRLRTGRASLALLEGLKVDYYGNATPLSQMANLAVPDSQTITIQPWDNGLIKDVEKCIQTSDLGLNPTNDGKIIRLTIPPLTGERRKQLVKILKKIAEDAKISIRNIRREFNDKIKNLEKESVPKDDCKKGQDKLQKVISDQIIEVDQIAQAKENDIMEN